MRSLSQEDFYGSQEAYAKTVERSKEIVEKDHWASNDLSIVTHHIYDNMAELAIVTPRALHFQTGDSVHSDDKFFLHLCDLNKCSFITLVDDIIVGWYFL